MRPAAAVFLTGDKEKAGDDNDSLPGDVSRIDQISISACFTMPQRKQASQPAFY
jgi:hypothetical protein